MPADPSCKLKLDLGAEASAANLEPVLTQAKALSERCGCRAVTLVFTAKGGFRTVSVGCLRGRRKHTEPAPGAV